ncbi:MAG TPA: DUF5666 domain-containing protein [Caldimonas sp.]|jgi:hypothetical protein|nr:DUF5666 domain-containing protein [Caldimonas sp.]HEX4234270.1 DUF5666 domain-containing protein [Caldimonas sp.]
MKSLFSPGPRVRALALFAALVVASCGGGVDSGGTGGPTVLAAGPVTGLGSVTVNGVRFDDSAATIVDQDGRVLSADQLQVGMAADIDASAIVASAATATATALTIRTHSEIVGPVEAVNRLGTVMIILGQPVRVTVATWFDELLQGGIGAVAIGDVVEVWGQYNARTGEYVATRIAPRPGATSFELRGPLAAVDNVAQTIVVGGLVVGIAAIPAAQRPTLAIGRFVRVTLATAPAAGVWLASALVPGNGTLPDRADARWAGRISSLTSATQFVVNGVTVDASAATFSDGGVGVVLGARVAVAGSSSGGVLKAARVTVLGDETLANSTFELHGLIGVWSPAQGTLRLHGVTVNVGSAVQFVGGSVADLAVGKQIDVIGTLTVNGIGIDAQTITFE